MKQIVNWFKARWAVAKACALDEQGFAGRRRFGGGGSSGGVGDIIVTALLVFVLFMFVINFVPEIEDAVLGFTTTLPMVEGMVTLMSWILPVGAIICALVILFRKIKA